MTKRFNISLEDLQELNLPDSLNTPDIPEVVDANSETVVDTEQTVFNDVIQVNEEQSEMDKGFDDCDRFLEVATTLESISNVLRKMPNIDGATYLMLGAAADMATAGTKYSSSNFMPSMESITRSVKDKTTSFAAESLADKAHSIFKDIAAFIQKLIQNAKDMVGKLIASFSDYTKAIDTYGKLINEAEKQGRTPKKEYELTSVPASVLGENGFISFSEYVKDLKVTTDYFTKFTPVSEDMSVICTRRLSESARTILDVTSNSSNREKLNKAFAGLGIQEKAATLGMKKESAGTGVMFVGPTLLGMKRGVFTFDAMRSQFSSKGEQNADNSWIKMKYDFTASESATDQRNNKGKSTPLELAKKIYELAKELLAIEKQKLSKHAEHMKSMAQFNSVLMKIDIGTQALKLFSDPLKMFSNLCEFVIQLNSKPTSYLRYVLSGSIWAMKTILNAQEGSVQAGTPKLTN